ncbi:MAG TPA: hypothetical protein VGE14_12980 [Marmoricola sp.]
MRTSEVVGQPPARRLTWESVATAAMCLGMALAVMPSLMVSNPPLITYSDVFFMLGMVMLLPRMLRGTVRASALYLIGVLTLLCMSLVSFALVPQPGQLQGIVRITYALVVLPSVMMLWRPSVQRVALLAGSYVVGTVVSVLYGVLQGARADGRNVGLTVHPNGLGHTALLAIALLPFILALRPSLRWAGLCAGVICAYGIWISGSRGSLIALVLLALVYILRERSATAALFAWGAGILLAVSWPVLVSEGSNNVLSRIVGGGTAGDATGQRELALHDAMVQIQAHPFLGNGFGTIREAQIAYVQVLAALGILGLVGFVLVLAALALPVLTTPGPTRLLSYAAVAYVLLAPFTDSVSDTLVWAALSLCVLVGRISLTPDPVGESTPAEAVERGSTGVPGANSSRPR